MADRRRTGAERPLTTYINGSIKFDSSFFPGESVRSDPPKGLQKARAERDTRRGGGGPIGIEH